jgi:hypothetical protein
MTAYGLAFVSILWVKLPIVINAPIIRNLHHVIIIIICALPLILSLPHKVRLGLYRKDIGGLPNWPPYYAPVHNLGLNKLLNDSQICVTDQPWATAWYADRISIWLPTTAKDFIKYQMIADDLDTPIAGILISPSSHGSDNIAKVVIEYKDFSSLILEGQVLSATDNETLSITKEDSKIKEIMVRYPYRYPLILKEMIYYSDRDLNNPEEKN